jgi:hypothetical protein
MSPRAVVQSSGLSVARHPSSEDSATESPVVFDCSATTPNVAGWVRALNALSRRFMRLCLVRRTPEQRLNFVVQAFETSLVGGRH